MNWWLILIPVSSALSSWLVFKLYLVFIFHPRSPKKILGTRVRGILPAKQTSIAKGLGKIVAEQFFSMKMIEEKITDPSNLQKIMPSIEAHIDDFLRNKLKKQMPVISMFIGDKTVDSLKNVFISELEILFPQIMKNYAGNLVNDFNIEKMITEKISSISLSEVELSFKNNFSKQLRQAEWFSFSLGLLIGLITMSVVYFIK